MIADGVPQGTFSGVNPDLSSETTPLFNVDAEMALLGSILLEPKVAKQYEHLPPDVFYRPAHRKIMEAVQALSKRGEVADLVTVSSYLGPEGLKAIGGDEYLIAVGMHVPSCANHKAFARIVFDKASLRGLDAHSRKVQELLRSGESAADIIASAQSSIRGVVVGGGDLEWIKDWDPLTIRPRSFVSTGWSSVDALNEGGGFPCGQISVWSAYSKAGKTTSFLTSAIHACQRGDRVMYATFADLSAEDVRMRMMRALCGWEERPRMDRNGQAAFDAAALDISLWDLGIYDGEGTFADFRQVCLSRHYETPWRVVYMDYFQEVKSSDRQSEYDRLRILSRDIRDLAKELPESALVVASQVTEGSEKMGTRTITKGGRDIEERAGAVYRLQKIDDGAEVKLEYSRYGYGADSATLGYDKARAVLVERA